MLRLTFLFMVIGFLSNCTPIKNGTSSADIEENAQQVGDVMASVDEAGGSTGSIATYTQSINKTYARFYPTSKSELIFNHLNPQVEATSCNGYGFDNCSGGVITRNFNGCTVGTATMSGTATITWSAGSCAATSAGDTITRVPNITLTGRRSATLAITKSGSVGQRLTLVSGSGASRVFSFSNDGIRRKFTLGSTVLFDQTTSTTSNITVTGTARTNRVMNGGVLRVFNNVSNAYCDYSPTNVTWSSALCNCPIQGSWAGSCSDGKSVTLEITGCGTANYTEGTDTSTVSFDRCGT